MHSRCFRCGTCPDPCTDRQLFAARAFLERSFFQSSVALSCELSRARGVGDAGSLTPRCSAIRIRCMHCDVKWSDTCHQHGVRTTTTTTTTQKGRANPKDMSRESCSCQAGSRASNAKAIEKLHFSRILMIRVRSANPPTSFFALGLVDHAAGDTWNLYPEATGVWVPAGQSSRRGGALALLWCS